MYVRPEVLTGENIIVTRYILDLKTDESKAVLDLLFNHITTSQDIQCQVKWEKGTVVVWDVSADAYRTPFTSSSRDYKGLLQLPEPCHCALASLIFSMVKFVIWHV